MITRAPPGGSGTGSDVHRYREIDTSRDIDPHHCLTEPAGVR
jgi:hypothetical protein